MSTTLSRLLDSVFSGTKFVPQHTGINEDQIFRNNKPRNPKKRKK